MINIPDRISNLIEKIEAGEQVDLAKVASLQALDLAKIGQDFVKETVLREEILNDELERALENERQS